MHTMYALQASQVCSMIQLKDDVSDALMADSADGKMLVRFERHQLAFVDRATFSPNDT